MLLLSYSLDSCSKNGNFIPTHILRLHICLWSCGSFSLEDSSPVARHQLKKCHSILRIGFNVNMLHVIFTLPSRVVQTGLLFIRIVHIVRCFIACTKANWKFHKVKLYTRGNIKNTVTAQVKRGCQLRWSQNSLSKLKKIYSINLESITIYKGAPLYL